MQKITRLLAGKKQFSFLSDGDSMLPVLQSGDLIYYRKVSYQSIRENDLILVRKKGVFITHRVIYKRENYLVTKGDNNAYSDGMIKPAMVIAKAVRLKRNNKTVAIDELYSLQSLLYFHEISRIIAALRKEKVEPVILKGLPLHLHYEGRHPRRIYADCDILIGKNSAAKTRTILEKAGYRRMENAITPQHGRLMDKKTEDSYIKYIGSFPILFDVHYEAIFMMTQLGRLDALYPQEQIDKLTRELLCHKQYRIVQDKRFPLLKDSYLIIYLLLHFFHHNFKGTFRLSLINTVLKQNSGNTGFLDEVAAITRRFRLEGYVYPGFVFLKNYFDSRFSSSFLDSIKPPPAQLAYIGKAVVTVPPFDDGDRIEGGITRFRQLFHLSPGSLWRKSLIFLTPSVIYSVVWVLAGRLKKLTGGQAKADRNYANVLQ